MKAIIFDFDGTLIKSENIKSNIFTEIFYDIYKKKKNVKKTYDSLIGKANLEKKIEIVIKKITLNKPSEKEIINFKKIFSQKYRERLSSCPIIHCMHLLNYIKLNTEYLFVVSLHEKNDVKKILKHCSLDKFFTSIYGGPITKKDNISNLMKKYNLKNDEMIYIGDTENDMLISKKMKIKSIGVNNKLSKRKILKEIGAIETYKDVCKIPFKDIIYGEKCQ